MASLEKKKKKFYLIKYYNDRIKTRMTKVFTSKLDAEIFCTTANITEYEIFETEDAKDLTNSSVIENHNNRAVDKKEKELDDWENQFVKKFTAERGVETKAKENKTDENEYHTIDKNIQNINYDNLSESQKNAYQEMMSGNNIFLTGDAGTGKSTVINKFVNDSRDEGKVIMVTGSTGIASENLGGVTIHKLLSIPWNDLGKLIAKDWADVSAKAKSILRITDTLIIDEISMIDFATFEYIISVLEHSNKNREKKGNKPTQLIVVGDFLQLPPVVEDRKNICKEYYPAYNEGFCFESDAWKRMKLSVVKLTEVVRQNEKDYIEALSRLKLGDATTKEYFNKRYQHFKKVPKNSIFLYGTNEEANKKNLFELSKIQKQEWTFRNKVEINPQYKGKVTLSFPETLTIKVGSRVMAVTNDLEGKYKNGSLGTVLNIDSEKISVAFDSGVSANVVRADEAHFTFNIEYDYETGKPNIVKQWQYAENNFPLKLAYAITIHKSQGQTFDNVVIFPSCFANGQLYVALSRCKTFDGIYLLKPIEQNDIKVSNSVLEFQKKNNLL